MSCRFDKTSFLKNGADEVGQECADLDQNKQKGITLIPFYVMNVPIYERPAKDSDDVIRRARLSYVLDGKEYPALGVAPLLLAGGNSDVSLDDEGEAE
ncbi:MAG: hypothetical protein IIY76_05200, partial [Erysipelotrichaceae bacterium]|nr:hypothetical protein [Erysipelotrichaceae bacterium]